MAHKINKIQILYYNLKLKHKLLKNQQIFGRVEFSLVLFSFRNVIFITKGVYFNLIESIIKVTGNKSVYWHTFRTHDCLMFATNTPHTFAALLARATVASPTAKSTPTNSSPNRHILLQGLFCQSQKQSAFQFNTSGYILLGYTTLNKLINKFVLQDQIRLLGGIDDGSLSFEGYSSDISPGHLCPPCLQNCKTA